ncbi:MAG: hypothetical protein E3K37_09805 [Candidatus Kuenenia sp.]|nr:hypothetical protein [Candidatus Kuenenia hertensis]
MFSFFRDFDKQSFKRELKHAFSVGKSQEDILLNEKEQSLVSRLAAIIHKKRLTTPAIMFLECLQPLNYIGSQAMVFFRPFLTFFFSTREYDLLQGILEKRTGIKRIIEELEKIPGQQDKQK